MATKPQPARIASQRLAGRGGKPNPNPPALAAASKTKRAAQATAKAPGRAVRAEERAAKRVHGAKSLSKVKGR